MDEKDISIKKELYSLYQDIKKYLKNSLSKNQNQQDIPSDELSSLIKYIKDSIPLLVSSKENNNSGNDDYEKLLENYKQLEKYCIKLEYDIKFYIKKYFHYKIQKDALEMKLQAYMELEEEYDDLKQKVKYEGGKFLENDRKDNEIIIVRRENSTLKHEISNLENENKEKSKKYEEKISDLQKNIENLNKKIFKLETELKNINKFSINANSLENTIEKYNKNEYYSIKNYKNICSGNLNNTINSKKLSNIHSPKTNLIYLEHNKLTSNNNINNNSNINSNNSKTINTINNIFTSTYNRIKNNNNNTNKIRFPIKNELNILKNCRNNSMNAIRFEEEEKRHSSIQKIIHNRSGNKGKYTQILNNNPKNKINGFISPLSSKNQSLSNTTAILQHKLIKANNSAINIMANSK